MYSVTKNLKGDFSRSQIEKFKKGLCITLYCRNERAVFKGSSVCRTCESRKYRKKYPVKYVFERIRKGAERRGIYFGITLDEFKSFISKNPEYMEFKGREVGDLQIDRIDISKGYVLENIRVITAKENRAKQNVEYGWGEHGTMDNEDVPF